MNNKFIFILIIIIIVALFFIFCNNTVNESNEDIIISWCAGHIDDTDTYRLFVVAGDGQIEIEDQSVQNDDMLNVPAETRSANETIMKHGNRLIIYTIDPHESEEIIKSMKPGETAAEYLDILGEPEHIFEFNNLNPLKVQIGDVTGNGIKDISLCVYKETEFHPVMAKRPFFYEYDIENYKLKPVWLGSRLTHPFIDYILADIDGDGMDELISINILKNGKLAIYAYKWRNFGFIVMARSDEFDDIFNLRAIYIEDAASKSINILADIIKDTNKTDDIVKASFEYIGDEILKMNN